jgi:hypothetical protein
MELEINKNDVEILNRTLFALIEKDNVCREEITQLCDGDSERSGKLRDILITEGYAKKSRNFDRISRTELTERALSLDVFRNAHEKELEEKKRKTDDLEKLHLEISLLKSKNRLIKPAFIISLISLLIALLSMLFGFLLKN